MTAICGVIRTDGAVAPEALGGVRSALAPLGPDGEGVWTGSVGRCGVALAAAVRRRAPEDAGERQPVTGEDGLALVGDVRLANRSALVASLGERGPDSAVVLAAYRRWGPAMLDRLQGSLALAVADPRRGGVLVARDAMGAAPLAMWERGGTLAFASLALALAEFEGVGHALDERRVAEYLVVGIGTERTFLSGVRVVPPASALWIDADGIRQRRWWTPAVEPVDLGSSAAHEAELRAALDLAVEGRLRGPIGALAGGGLDSTAVAATAAILRAPDPVATYTSAPPAGWRGAVRPGWDADESELVRDLAALHPNLVPRIIRLPPTDDLLGAQTALWDLGAPPLRDPPNARWTAAAQRHAARDGLVGLLTGTLGNAHLSADGPGWLVALLRAGQARRGGREAAAWRRATGASWSRVLRSHVAVPALTPRARTRVERALRRPTRSDRWIASTPVRRDALAGLDLHALVPVLDDAEPVRAAELAASRLVLADQAEHALVSAAVTGVAFDDPTADRRVVEAALRQPEWVRRRDGRTRAAVRGAMAGRVPASILERTRRGEQAPEWLDLMTAARPSLEAELARAREHPVCRALIDVERLGALFARWPDQTAGGAPSVMRDYRLVLLRALLTARYVRWFEQRGAARRTRTG